MGGSLTQIMSSTVVSSAFAELFDGFASQVSDLKGLSMLRNSGDSDHWCTKLTAMDQSLSSVEQKMKTLKSYIARERESSESARSYETQQWRSSLEVSISAPNHGRRWTKVHQTQTPRNVPHQRSAGQEAPASQSQRSDPGSGHTQNKMCQLWRTLPIKSSRDALRTSKDAPLSHASTPQSMSSQRNSANHMRCCHWIT